MSAQFDVTSTGKEHFEMALKIAFSNAAGGKATHYRIDKDKGLCLYWHEDKDTIPLPYPLHFEAAREFAWGWLMNADYGEEPDHDGSNGKGFRVYNEQWGHVYNSFYGFVGIQPEWIIYSK